MCVFCYFLYKKPGSTPAIPTIFCVYSASNDEFEADFFALYVCNPVCNHV